jgi:membrane-associated protein
VVELAKGALSFVLHLDVHLGAIVAKYGVATYGILFAIVFAETGGCSSWPAGTVGE